MKINKNCWHYKIQKRNNRYPEFSKNLCDYVNGLIIASICELTNKILIPIWLITSPFIFIYYILETTIPTTGIKGIFYNTVFWLAMAGIAIDTIIITEKIGSIIGPYLPKLKWKEKKEKIKKEKRPNLFLEWLKAKKKKICPLIEFVEEIK